MPEDAAIIGQIGEAVDEKIPAGFSPITTQEQFDQAIKDRLARSEKSFEKKYKDVFDKAKQFDELKEKNKSDLEKAQEKASKLEAELNEIKLQEQIAAWKKAASEDTGVPVDVLRGKTEEEITAHAEALKPHFEKPSGFVGSDGFAVSTAKTRKTSDLFAEAVENAL